MRPKSTLYGSEADSALTDDHSHDHHAPAGNTIAIIEQPLSAYPFRDSQNAQARLKESKSRTAIRVAESVTAIFALMLTGILFYKAL